VALLLLGPFPLRRSFAYVSGWAMANGLAILALMLVGDRFSLALNHGEQGQVAIDLVGAVALLGIGLFQLTPAAELGQEGMAVRLLNQLPDVRTPLLVLIGATSEAGLLLVNQPGVSRDLELTGVFVLVASSLLLLPPLAWIATGGGIREPLLQVEGWLVHRAEWVVGVLALLISTYLAWEGLHGLWLLRGAAPL
jgi:hypothetical protein